VRCRGPGKLDPARPSADGGERDIPTAIGALSSRESRAKIRLAHNDSGKTPRSTAMTVLKRDTEYHTYSDYLTWCRDYGDELIDGTAYVTEPPSPEFISTLVPLI
jgi:hypothetical protein